MSIDFDVRLHYTESTESSGSAMTVEILVQGMPTGDMLQYFSSNGGRDGCLFKRLTR
jgi:hypothetical protein